ncbi:hypothetical protein PYW08_004119 [Mythimna loreyi]|uniref:Uncharacterized protein n=1 Tax=Mythimna loreyi TaxID=667449 RepID=A0ACC2QV34_9NEOP|nr:hypothetical protein PYW08_004119 [Mythimna loreyi]
MDSDDSVSETKTIETVCSVQTAESSEDPPMEDWSSLEILSTKDIKKEPSYGKVCGPFSDTSASSVFKHSYYNYPAIPDPGIEVALLAPQEMITYPADGQALYLALCKEMNQCPVRSFYKGLLEHQIDLRYYGINPNGFRAMAKALQYNNTVEILNLTDNFLNNDACYHMGDMLLSNNVLTELNLRGCRIGPQGAKRLFHSLHYNRSLKVLDLSYNQLGDEGMKPLATAVNSGLDVKKLNLSYNNISGIGVEILGNSLETNNKFTHLDLSWNQLYRKGGDTFLVKLSESTCLEVLNLSWNTLSGNRIAILLKGILLCPQLSELNLSNNQLEGKAITIIAEKITKAQKLDTLNLSYNPMTPKDALHVLNKVTMVTSNMKKIFMDNVDVNEAFLSLLEHTKEKESKKDLVVTYGDVVRVFRGTGPDAREVVLNRVEYMTKTKKNKADIALIALKLQKENYGIMNAQNLSKVIRAHGAVLDEDLVNELCKAFPGPPQKNAKTKVVNINLLVDYIKQKWPNRKLPLISTPEPEPVLVPPKPIEKAKEKRKGKK